MQQKNKQTKNYFAYAIYSVIFTSLLFIIFGSNGWGPSAANEQAIWEISRWCERVSGGFFREPVNTLGNLGFVAAGLFMFYKIYKDKIFDLYNSINLLGFFILLQIFLGIITVLYGAQIYIASMHQISSIFLVSSCIYFLFLNTRFN